MAFRGLLRQQSRYFPMIFDLITSVTGCVPVKVERKLERFGTQMEREWNANGTQMERKWNANGTQMEREWNANGTQKERIYERVPNAFSVRLFLSSTVYLSPFQLCNTFLLLHRSFRRILTILTRC